ncbi:MAG: hypothetical protein H6R14_1223 [Proteobacteria bacterium]|nr:hypothetical protein [Pseudomonadota bacterium]
MLARFALGAMLIAPAAESQARPAPWYWWVSAVGDARICAQTSPGAAWQRENTAFRDSQCSIRVKPF